MTYKVIIYDMSKADGPALLIVHHTDKKNAERVCRIFCGSGFAMNRRDDIHTFDHIVVKIEKD